MGLEELRQRIIKGEDKISDYEYKGIEVPQDWYYHLALLIENYKEDSFESLINKINKEYADDLFDWLFENAVDVYNKNIEIEEKIEKASIYEFNIQEFDNIINELREWYKKAICHSFTCVDKKGRHPHRQAINGCCG